MRMRLAILTVVGVCLISAASRAADGPAAGNQPAASQPATSQPAPSGVIAATDYETISKNVGKELTVRGKVSDALKRTVILLNFEGVENRNFVAVVKKENVDALQAGFNGDL